ncbi:MAG TPA: 16S rRNA (cytidine(1402)-2'-O)-methyltransferase, partial [candidate division Zixibacteria bacterium]|nr:16S rRNA (cytidine(1402)-2'-O)-methyltransferase [candidate division Zixibacteria bacterium]
IPTPIGNLEDLSERARRTLTEVQVIACEDTRVTRKLLGHIGARARLISYHDYNEELRAPALLALLKAGQDVAVVSDAGSPGISDPAYRVIAAAIDEHITIIPLPGPTSIIPALTASGLPTDRFFFEGFAPRTAATRKRRFRELAELPHTIIFLESPQRLNSTLRDALAVFGERRACVAREISKLHEEFARGTLSELSEQFGARKPRGEITLVIEGKQREKRVKTNKYAQEPD